MNQLKVVNKNARRILKHRIDRANKLKEQQNTTTSANDDQNQDDTIIGDEYFEPISDMSVLNNENEADDTDLGTIKPQRGQYWKIKNGNHRIFAVIAEEDPLGVQYFHSSVKGNYHCLNSTIYEVLIEDLDVQVPPPTTVPNKGKRQFYSFE